MLTEAKPFCSTPDRRLSRAAHVDMTTVELSLSDPDVHDLSRIRTEKQQTASLRVRQGCGKDTKETRRNPKTPLSDTQFSVSECWTYKKNPTLHLNTYQLERHYLVGRQLGDAVDPVVQAPEAGRGRSNRSAMEHGRYCRR